MQPVISQLMILVKGPSVKVCTFECPFLKSNLKLTRPCVFFFFIFLLFLMHWRAIREKVLNPRISLLVLHTILNDRKLLKIIPPCFADKFKNGYVGIISVKKGEKKYQNLIKGIFRLYPFRRKLRNCINQFLQRRVINTFQCLPYCKYLKIKPLQHGNQ